MYKHFSLKYGLCFGRGKKNTFPLPTDPAWKFWVAKQQTNLILRLASTEVCAQWTRSDFFVTFEASLTGVFMELYTMQE